uniref:Uncharacterized protein n=1 Tax=Rhizophora mucronata TaxID=61149 RepID=A0A2P2N7T1_RHIMU
MITCFKVNKIILLSMPCNWGLIHQHNHPQCQCSYKR